MMNGVATETIKDKTAVNTANTNWKIISMTSSRAVCRCGTKGIVTQKKPLGHLLPNGFRKTGHTYFQFVPKL